MTALIKFESNHSGIVTVAVYPHYGVATEFESNHSGIVTLTSETTVAKFLFKSLNRTIVEL